MSDVADFVVDIEPGAGTSLRISVQADGLAPIADELERALPSFLPADLDQLRSGSATERVADALADQVTSWLLQSDLRGRLGTAFNAAAAPFRIILGIHPKVLAELAEVPFELLRYDADPLVLHHRVRSIVHMQKRPRAAPAVAMRSGWPLRILLVRANPADLGGKVPLILPLRDRVRALSRACRLGDAVEVTALSSEPGGSGPVTYDALRENLRDRRHDVLVYLGHGDLQDAGFAELPPMGVLQFELDGSPYENPVRADQLRNELQNHPVPVVVLAGCVTAASEAVMRKLPQWMRGNQSVAESLIYGDSGVQCAVGMRYRLETADAERFLGTFFESLIRRAPGDVEQAVRAGRDDLFARKPFPPSWSAPVIFRTAGAEPMFEWMRRSPGVIDPLDEYEQAMRERGWKALSSLPGSAPIESRAFPDQLLAQLEAGFVVRWTQRGAAVLWPAPIDAGAGKIARVSITLQGALAVSNLGGRLTFPPALMVRATRPGSALATAGLRAYFACDQAGAVNFILHGPSPAPLPAGALLEIDLELPAEAPAVHGLSVDSLVCDPPALLRGWNNALVLSPP